MKKNIYTENRIGRKINRKQLSSDFTLIFRGSDERGGKHEPGK
jgi:hypothetical protein